MKRWSVPAGIVVSLSLVCDPISVQSARAFDQVYDRVVVNAPGDGFLALRSEPTTSSGRRLAKIPHGTAIRLGGCQSAPNGGNWCQTSFNGLSGWVLDRYLVPIGVGPVDRTTSGSDRPVMVGEDPTFDACPSQGVVRGLKRGGDGFLAVRSGPSTTARMIDKLHEGDAVNLCDHVAGWQGVVYTGSPLIDCGVSSPIIPMQPYSGPCTAGWVSERFIETIAD